MLERGEAPSRSELASGDLAPQRVSAKPRSPFKPCHVHSVQSLVALLERLSVHSYSWLLLGEQDLRESDRMPTEMAGAGEDAPTVMCRESDNAPIEIAGTCEDSSILRHRRRVVFTRSDCDSGPNLLFG